MEAKSLHQEGGRRRIDRVLAPGFSRDLQELSVSELKQRRDEALAEREYLSLLRRFVHGRLDILRGEAVRRTETGTGAASLVERLTAVLSEEDRASSRGEALRLTVPEEDAAVARRRVERLVSDTTISNAPSLSDEELERSGTRLQGEERMVSKARAAVIAVHDRLQEELKRRYKEDLSQISTS